MNAKKTLCLGVMMASAGWSGLAAAETATAYGAICDTAAKAEWKDTSYYSCSGTDYRVVHIYNGTCSEWSHKAMLAGSYHYRYTGGCPAACVGGSSCNDGKGNYYIVTGSNGWDFRQLFVNANYNSYSKTCDRCALGLVGASGSYSKPMVYAANTQYGVRSTAWYTGVLPSCGAGSGYCGNIIGYPTL